MLLFLLLYFCFTSSLSAFMFLCFLLFYVFYNVSFILFCSFCVFTFVSSLINFMCVFVPFTYVFCTVCLKLHRSKINQNALFNSIRINTSLVLVCTRANKKTLFTLWFRLAVPSSVATIDETSMFNLFSLRLKSMHLSLSLSLHDLRTDKKAPAIKSDAKRKH